MLRRLRWSCPPWIGTGLYLDVECGSGAALAVAQALGWRITGIEMDEAAAAIARRFTDELHVGDVVTAFHVLEHVPDPVAVTRRMLDWLAPGGLLIVKVPNAGGLGAALFGRAWSGLELPRHLSHFTPATLELVLGKAGGRIAWCWHQAKPRSYLWSLSALLRDRGWNTLAKLTESRPVYGALKLGLEVLLPLARLARRGEAIRVGSVRNRPT
jgi:SAM-dependent methyltransferase